MKRLTKEDWIKTGLHLLSEHGEDLLRIEILCRQLNVSKGSFYHHFKNVEDYIHELMSHWETENTLSVIETTEGEPSIDEKIEKLNQIVSGKDHLLEVRLRAWSVRNGSIKKYLEKVDQQRMDYLKQLYLEKGIEEDKAKSLSKIEYSTFVGIQHLFNDMPIEEKMNLSKLFYTLINNEIR